MGTHHPSEPQAGLTSRAQGHVGRGDVRRGLQALDLSGRLAGGTGPNDVHLTHTEPGATCVWIIDSLLIITIKCKTSI